MDWFERYLQAVRKHLPFERQDDIIAELRANLEAQLEERQAELGRPLTDGEILDWLKELGPPMRMAARYQPARYLIGPNVFPMYWYILRLVAIWSTIAYAVSILIRTFTEQHGSEWIAQALLGYPGVLITGAAWITIVFVVLEFVSERYPEKCPPFFSTSPHWSPTGLPPLEEESAFEGKPRSLTTAVAEFVAGFVLLVWLLLIPRHPFLVLGPAAALLERSPLLFAPVVAWFYWTAVALHAFQWAWQGYNLLADKWRTKHPLRHLAGKTLGLAPIAILIGAPERVYVMANPASTAALPAGLQVGTVNHYIFLGCTVVAFISIIDFAVDMWKASNASRRHQFRTVL